VNAIQEQINRIVSEGEGLMVSSFIWLEDVPRLVTRTRDGDAHARFSLELFIQAVERDMTRGAVGCLFCARSVRLTHCGMLGALHAPRAATGAVLFVASSRVRRVSWKTGTPWWRSRARQDHLDVRRRTAAKPWVIWPFR